MRIKMPLTIVAPLVLLSITIVFFCFHYYQGRLSGESRNSELAEAGSRYSPSDANFDALHKRIDEAVDSGQFKMIAREVLDTISPGEPVNRLMSLLLDRWIEKDMVAALDFVSHLEREGQQETLLRYTLIEGGYLDFRRVMDWISQQSEPKRQGLAALLYEGVAKDNPEYALGFIDLLSDEDVKERIVRLVLEQWAERDIAEAVSWAYGQALPQTLDDVKRALLSRLIEQDAQEAGAVIREMQAGHEKNTVARKYANLLARTDVQAAANWARSLDDRDAYGIALTAVYEAWFRSETDKKLIMEQVLVESDSDLRDRLINEIALDIANSNPAELAHMIDRLPTTSQQDVAEKAVRFWKERDPQQTLNWVNGLPSGPVRDRASKVMVEDFLLRGDKEGALSLALSIGERGARYESIRKIAEYWYDVNPDEARQTLNSISALTETEKEKISSGIQKTHK